MIISFCGHSTYIEKENHQTQVLQILESEIGDEEAEFFLGEYGCFDSFAYKCAKIYQKNHINAKLIYITPYIKNKKDILVQPSRFDGIIYPPLETVPKRYAIFHRNRWIVDNSDVIITYIEHSFGGAFEMYKYAQKQHKKIYNLTRQTKHPKIIPFL